MTKRPGVILAASLALLSACEDGAPPENRTSIKVENPAHERLLQVSSLNRRIALRNAIRDNGQRCQRVDGAAYQEDYRGMVMWVALCNDLRHWAVFIAPNGDTQVRDCAQMAQLNLPQCRPVPIAPASESDVNML